MVITECLNYSLSLITVKDPWFKFSSRYVRKLPLMRGPSVFFSGNSDFFCLQHNASHNLAFLCQKSENKENYHFYQITSVSKENILKLCLIIKALTVLL